MPMRKGKKNIINPECLILGIGNEIVTDDGIGPKIVKRLEKDLNIENIKFETAFMGGLDILEYVRGFKTAIFIDAIKTKNGIPGEVYEFSLSDFKETLHLSNLHDISFLTAFELGKQLDYKVPKNNKIIAIEIVEDLVYSNSFSPEIEKKYELIYKTVKKSVISFLNKYSTKKVII